MFHELQAKGKETKEQSSGFLPSNYTLFIGSHVKCSEAIRTVPCGDQCSHTRECRSGRSVASSSLLWITLFCVSFPSIAANTTRIFEGTRIVKTGMVKARVTTTVLSLCVQQRAVSVLASLSPCVDRKLTVGAPSILLILPTSESSGSRGKRTTGFYSLYIIATALLYFKHLICHNKLSCAIIFCVLYFASFCVLIFLYIGEGNT